MGQPCSARTITLLLGSFRDAAEHRLLPNPTAELQLRACKLTAGSSTRVAGFCLRQPPHSQATPAALTKQDGESISTSLALTSPQRHLWSAAGASRAMDTPQSPCGDVMENARSRVSRPGGPARARTASRAGQARPRGATAAPAPHSSLAAGNADSWPPQACTVHV